MEIYQWVMIGVGIILIGLVVIGFIVEQRMWNWHFDCLERKADEEYEEELENEFEED